MYVNDVEYMWYFQIEIKYYSIAYFKCITKFVALLC